ncbi:MAG: pilus assembly protein TadG-related protein [Bdellovibrionales bacterium]
MLMKLLQKCRMDERGSAIPLIGLTLFALVGTAGVAVDSGRAYLVQSRMLTAVDAAGLAAGSSVSTQNVQSEVEKYMDANYPDGYVDSTITSVVATPSADNTVINITATATVPTVFMGIFGHDEMTVEVESQVTRTQKGLEVVLVLDTTGSMAGSKLTGAKTAAHDLLDILYGDNETVDDLWVGMVPFAQAVNIGPSRTAWLDATHYASLNWHPTTWAGCVEARETNDKDVSDHTPEDQPYKAYYWPDHNSYNNWVTITEVPVYEEVCTPIYCGKKHSKYQCGEDCDMEVVGYEEVTEYTITSTKGPNKYCSQEVTPLTASKATVDAAIDTLVAEGNTHIVLGAVWAWHMLDPTWRGMWGGEMDTNNLPLDYNTPLMNKAVVLMTDGDNVISNSVKGAYGYLSEGRLGTTDSGDAADELDERLETVCTAMKNNNITIYTIGFGGGISGSTLDMLEDCASQPDYFFNSPTNEDLQVAFKMIGDSLANLRISK